MRAELAAGVVCGLVLWALVRRRHLGAASSEPRLAAIDPKSAAATRAVTLLHDGGEAAQEITNSVLREALHDVNLHGTASIAGIGVEELLAAAGNGACVFCVEVDAEGEAPGGRALTRALKRLAADQRPLQGRGIAVLALARSVCAFSAASGGMDKFRGAARLEAALVKAGAQTLCAMGMAEVEVREVDESVLPWCRSLASALVYTRQARGQA